MDCITPKARQIAHLMCTLLHAEGTFCTTLSPTEPSRGPQQENLPQSTVTAQSQHAVPCNELFPDPIILWRRAIVWYRIRTAGLALRARPAVRILHQAIVQRQIRVRKGAQRSDL